MDEVNKIQVVLVEDSEADWQLVLRMMRKLNPAVEIEHFPDAEAAAGAILDRDPQEWWPRLFVLDVNLPGMSGLEFLRILKSSTWRRVPAIMLSGSASNNEVQSSYDLGAGGYLTKPVGSEAMRRTFAGMTEFWLNLAAPTEYSADHAPHEER